jgi:hypothetical protein
MARVTRSRMDDALILPSSFPYALISLDTSGTAAGMWHSSSTTSLIEKDVRERLDIMRWTTHGAHFSLSQ